MIGDAIAIRAWIVLILNIVCSEMITMRISMLMLSKLLHFSNGFKLFSMARCTLIGTRQKKSLFSKQASPKSWKNQYLGAFLEVKRWRLESLEAVPASSDPK